MNVHRQVDVEDKNSYHDEWTDSTKQRRTTKGKRDTTKKREEDEGDEQMLK